MVKCVFCGNEESIHKGVHLIKNEGSISYFCSSKCRKNALKLGRDKRKVKWTNFFHENRQKAVAKESARAAEAQEKKNSEKKESSKK